MLKRQTGENLIIGMGVSITALKVKGNQVKTGIPPIRREEIYVQLNN
ncbi:carbon storage regulator [Microbulbifer sp. TRSA005]